MKLSENWLREWVDPKIPREELIKQLTMAGLAVESCEKAGDDYIFEFELTPNRGDCLSVLGIAREVAAIYDIELSARAKMFLTLQTEDTWASLCGTNDAVFPIQIASPSDCPRYLGTIIKEIPNNGVTPQWMKDKLNKSGVNCISPIVDVMNFVMLEIGQPLHAFDLDKLKNKIIVRRAAKNEPLALLDSKTVNLDENVLVIADDERAHAMAGIMGGADSAVTEQTRNILIESAHFTPYIIAGRARRFGLQTDASYRFERGVDLHLPLIATVRAIGLLGEIFGEQISVYKIINKTSAQDLTACTDISLRHERINKVLGLNMTNESVEKLLTRAGMSIIRKNDSWSVKPPSYRFDISIEEDLIEEIARLYGYDNIPVSKNSLTIQILPQQESQIKPFQIKQRLIDFGYHEIITYSFIDEKLQRLFDPDKKALALTNPLSAELAVMRTSLWPGLIEIVRYNLNRQQELCSFFEMGLRFVPSDNGLQQEAVLSGVLAGLAYPEQWGEKKRFVDFFDIKNHLTQLQTFIWKPDHHTALHPAQTAALYQNDQCVGYCGALHPELQQQLDIKVPVFLFEIKLEAVLHHKLPQFQSISKFPGVRRDIAIIVDRSVTVEMLQQTIQQTAVNLLKDFCVFDVYQGKNIPEGKKSIALGMVFQSRERTLIEDEINTLIQNILNTLVQKFSAILRE